jgi:hypothetical protein
MLREGIGLRSTRARSALPRRCTPAAPLVPALATLFAAGHGHDHYFLNQAALHAIDLLI